MTETMKIADLKPWANNPRKNDAAVTRVAESIRKFGFASPILVRKADNEVIAGHTRLKAAKMLGLKEVPVRVLDLSAEQAHQLAMADNKLGELADWDEDMLAALLANVTIGDAAAMGWEAAELGAFLDAELPDGGGESKLSGLTYSIVIECADEDEQTSLLERLESEGLSCKPLVS